MLSNKATDAFCNRKSGRSGALRAVSDGSIYTYGVKLAHWDGDTVIMNVPRGWRNSQTSTTHFNALVRSLEKSRISIVWPES